MRRAALRPTEITQREARAAFAMWRCNARDEAVAAETVDGLARRYRVPVRELEAGLLAEQDKRRRRGQG